MGAVRKNQVDKMTSSEELFEQASLDFQSNISAIFDTLSKLTTKKQKYGMLDTPVLWLRPHGYYPGTL